MDKSHSVPEMIGGDGVGNWSSEQAPLAVDSTSLETCIICLATKIPQDLELCPNNHMTCNQCLEKYANHLIDSRGVLDVNCPFPECGLSLWSRLTPAHKERITANRTAQTGQLSCSSCGSRNLQLGKYYLQLRNRFELVCGECNEQMCLFCHEPVKPWAWVCFSRLQSSWSGKPCHQCRDPAKRQLMTHVVNSGSETEGNQIKPCPNCFKLIFKTHGWYVFLKFALPHS